MSNYNRLKDIYNHRNTPILPIRSGMFLEIHEKVWEGDANRIWKFKGLVVKVKKPNHPDGTFTIRGEAARMTIEKIYPLSFPNFDKVLLMDDYKIRRSKLYYIRTKIWKDARFKSVIEHGKKGTDLLSLIKNEKAEVIEEKVETKEIQEPKVVEEKTVAEPKNAVESSVNEKVEEKKDNVEKNK